MNKSVNVPFIFSDFGTISAEASWVLVTSCIAVAIGGLQGGIRYINIATTKHLRGNEATVYESGIEARRKLLDKSHLSFMRGFLAHGIRTGFFMFSLTYVQFRSVFFIHKI